MRGRFCSPDQGVGLSKIRGIFGGIVFKHVLCICQQYEMMQISSWEEGEEFAQWMLFQKSGFGGLSPMNLKNLRFFSQANQQKFGKVKIKFNINLLKNFPSPINYILLTRYSQILFLPYLLRKHPSITILATKTLLHFASIYIRYFYQTIKNNDQISLTLSYEQQSTIYDNYQHQFGIILEHWVDLFSSEEMENCLKKCVALNYGEIYDTDKGIKLVSYPSGREIGGSVWILESVVEREKILWIQEICHHQWRACKQFSIPQLYQSIDTIIFCKGALKHVKEEKKDENQCLGFFQNLKKNLLERKNETVVLADLMLLCDFINYIAIELRGKFQQIFVSNSTATQLLGYANSYVDFLGQNYSKAIYEDPPRYPFDNYMQLKGKFLFEGSIEEIAVQQKIPVKELLLRATPYIHFLQDFQCHLFHPHHEESQIFTPSTSIKQLNTFLKSFRHQNIFCLGEADILKQLGYEYEFIPFGKIWRFKQQNNPKYFTIEGEQSLITKYSRKNGWLMLEKSDTTYNYLKNQWEDFLSQKLCQKQIPVTMKSSNQLQTQKSQIIIENYTLKLRSKSCEELCLIQNLLQDVMKKVKIK